MNSDEHNSADPRIKLAAWYLRPALRCLILVPITEALAFVTLLLLLRGAAGDPKTNLKASTAALVALEPPPVAKAENAAEDYKLAFTALAPFKQAMTDGEFSDLNSGDPDALDRPSTKKYLSLNRTALKAAFAATAKAQCNFELDYSADPALKIGHLGHMYSLAKLLALDARMKAHAGDHIGAAASLAAIYKLAQHTGADSLVRPRLTMLEIAEMADGALEKIIGFDPPTRMADITAYRTALWKNRNARQRMVECLKLEEVVCLQFVDKFAAHGISGPNSSAVFNCNTYAALLYASDRNCCKSFLDELRQRLQAGELLNSEQVQELLASHQSGPAVITSLLTPKLARYPVTGSECDTGALMAETALAYLQYAAKHSRDARSLEELTPEFLPSVPVDPFHGHPFELVSEPVGLDSGKHAWAVGRFGSQSMLKICSTGENGLDANTQTESDDNAKSMFFLIPPLQMRENSARPSGKAGGGL